MKFKKLLIGALALTSIAFVSCTTSNNAFFDYYKHAMKVNELKNYNQESELQLKLYSEDEKLNKEINDSLQAFGINEPVANVTLNSKINKLNDIDIISSSDYSLKLGNFNFSSSVYIDDQNVAMKLPKELSGSDKWQVSKLYTEEEKNQLYNFYDIQNKYKNEFPKLQKTFETIYKAADANDLKYTSDKNTVNFTLKVNDDKKFADFGYFAFSELLKDENFRSILSDISNDSLKTLSPDITGVASTVQSITEIETELNDFKNMSSEEIAKKLDELKVDYDKAVDEFIKAASFKGSYMINTINKDTLEVTTEILVKVQINVTDETKELFDNFENKSPIIIEYSQKSVTKPSNDVVEKIKFTKENSEFIDE